jgi:UTP--glucose-1-phosphate uridylyltransferase
MHLLDDPRLDWSLLDRYRFDRERFVADLARARRGEATPESAVVNGSIVPAPGTVQVDHDSSDARVAREIGTEALARGQVAVVVVNGGMATRFGGVVKGTVEVFDGLSFIALKARDVRRVGARFGRTPPLVLMNSFATHDATEAHVVQHGRFGLGAEDLLTFRQSISIRLTPEGDLFVGPDRKPSYYAPGHGDFLESIRADTTLCRLRERGVSVVAFANVDNLGATLDPVLIGMHVAGAFGMTFELTERRRDASGKWDAGGAPVLVDGTLAVVEGFRFPDGVQQRLPDFQTNNILFDAAAIDQPLELVRYPVIKQVGEQEALQFEAITCEASSARIGADPVFQLGLLRVPREGRHGRFYPVKTPADLDAMRDVLRARLAHGL